MHELHISNNFRYWACNINITDQGRELNNQISSKFYQLTGTQHRITSAYHPQSNGLVERSHRTIEDMIHKQVTPPDVNQLEILDSVLFAIRVSMHSSTRTSPFKILYGHEPKMSLEIDYEIKKGNPVSPSVQAMEEQWEEKSCEEKIEAILSIRQQVLVDIAGNIKKAQHTQSKYYSKILCTKPLIIGQKVFKRNLKDASRKEKHV